MSFQGINPRSAPPDAASPGASFELGDVLNALRARLSLILRVTVAVVAAAIVIVMLLPTRYVSSAVVILDQRKNAVADLSSVLSALPTDPASLQNQIQILQSRDLAAQVIAKLKLYDDPEFNGTMQRSVGNEIFSSLNPKHWFANDATPATVDPAVQRDAIIDTFLSHLSAESLGLSTAITVSFTARDGEKAARIANAVADTYVEDQINAKVDATEATSSWLTQRIRDLAKQVQIQEAAVLTYKAQHNLDSSPGGTSLVEAQLNGINTQIILARADYAAKTAIYTQVQNLMRSGNAANISQVVASPLIVQLRGQQAELMRQEADLTIRYGARNPKRIAVETQLNDLNQKIGEEVARVSAALANDVAVSRAQLGSLQGSLNSTQRQASGQDMTAVKLQALQADATTTRNLYDSFLTRLHAIQDQEGLQEAESRVISQAPVPSGPSSPPRLLIVIASLPAGLLLGCLIALLAERFSGGRAPARSRMPVAQRPRPAPVPVAPPVPAYRGPPILAEVPGAMASGAADYIVDWPASPFSRAIAELLRRVAAPSERGTGRIVCVTAPEPGASAATIALALSRAASQAQLRTILIDGNLTQPVIARALGVPVTFGVADVLQGTAALNRAFSRDPRSATLLLSGGPSVPDPAALLSSPRAAEFSSHLRGLADLIIICAPPVLGARETQALTRLSDAVVVVASPAPGPRPLLAKALQALGTWRSPPVGMVVAR